MFNKIGAVILLVSDMKKSIKFYGNVLGMELKRHPSRDWVEFAKEGNTVLALHPIKKTSKKRPIKKNNSMLVGFNISDIESVCGDLKKLNYMYQVRFSGLFQRFAYNELLPMSITSNTTAKPNVLFA